jgi:hypothetical protein
MSLSWVRLIQLMNLYPMYERYILIFFSHVRQSCKWSLSFSFPHQNPVCISIPPPNGPPISSILIQSPWWGVWIVMLQCLLGPSNNSQMPSAYD